MVFGPTHGAFERGARRGTVVHWLEWCGVVDGVDESLFVRIGGSRVGAEGGDVDQGLRAGSDVTRDRHAAGSRVRYREETEGHAESSVLGSLRKPLSAELAVCQRVSPVSGSMVLSRVIEFDRSNRRNTLTCLRVA